jgi:hypothetical protein
MLIVVCAEKKRNTMISDVNGVVNKRRDSHENENI